MVLLAGLMGPGQECGGFGELGLVEASETVLGGHRLEGDGRREAGKVDSPPGVGDREAMVLVEGCCRGGTGREGAGGSGARGPGIV